MEKILYVLFFLCICTIGNAQEYKIEEIEEQTIQELRQEVEQLKK